MSEIRAKRRDDDVVVVMPDYIAEALVEGLRHYNQFRLDHGLVADGGWEAMAESIDLARRIEEVDDE